MSEIVSPQQWLIDVQGVFNPGERQTQLGLAKLGRECQALVTDKRAGRIARITGSPGQKGTDKRIRIWVAEKATVNPVSAGNVLPLFHRAIRLLILGWGDQSCVDYFNQEMQRKGKTQTIGGLLDIALDAVGWFMAYAQEIAEESETEKETPVRADRPRDASEDVL